MPKIKARREQLQAGEAKLWIILVGINQYQDPNIENLRYSAVDCQELGKALEAATQQFLHKEIAVYHDFSSRPPILEEVVASLEKLQFAGENDTIIFYFSGHGFLAKDTQKPILCLADTRLENGSGDSSIVNPETGLKVEDLLTNYLAQCPAKQQLVFLDACHSGGLSFKQLAGAQRSLRLFAQKGDSTTTHKKPLNLDSVEVLNQNVKKTKRLDFADNLPSVSCPLPSAFPPKAAKCDYFHKHSKYSVFCLFFKVTLVILKMGQGHPFSNLTWAFA